MMEFGMRYEPTWGDVVRVSQQAPISFRPGIAAEIVGIRKLETQSQADQFASPIGTKVYLVEFGDGDSVEVPERWLAAVP
jgi:hypothetical protein